MSLHLKLVFALFSYQCKYDKSSIGFLLKKKIKKRNFKFRFK